MNKHIIILVLAFTLAAAACGESHTTDIDAGDEITFDAFFPDTGPDASTANNVGEACRDDTDCAGAASTCITELPGGYCSDDCASEEDCPDGSSCVQVGRGTFVCLDGCDPSMPDQCRGGYGCATGIGAPVCVPGCEDDTDCDGGTECDPAGGFTGEGVCFTPGSAIGDACQDSSECPSSAFCFSQERFGFPDGYCGGFGCNPDTNEGCDTGAVCLPGGRGGRCYAGCESDDDCLREGYECQQSPSYPDRSSCQPAFDPDDLGQICSAGRGSCMGACLSESDTGWPDSYCVSTGCDPGATESDCPGDGVCLETDSGIGICLDGCADVSDCRSGYDCRNSDSEDPTSGLACMPGCDGDSVCGNDEFVCNVGTGLCTQPFTASNLGEPCTDGEDCPGGRCLDEAEDGWPAGTCTYPGCRLSGTGPGADCGSSGICVDDGAGNPELGVCVEECTAGTSTCRPGYDCILVDAEVTDGPLGCQPACASDSCGGSRTCNTETGRCE